MSKKLIKILIIPTLITVIFFVIQAIPLLTHFGISSTIEEKSLDFEGESKPGTPLLKNKKTSANINATENNLGVLLVRFEKFGRGSDTLMFRIKKEGDKKWYYENKYFGELFQENQYYPFGFPPIPNSKNNSYIIEIESLSGQNQNGVAVSGNKPQTAFVYSYPIDELKNPQLFLSFVSKKFLYVLNNTDYFRVGSIFVLSIFVVRFFLSLKKNPRKMLLKYIKSIKSVYLSIKRKIIRFLKQLGNNFTSIKIYHLFLNTNIKKRIAIGLFIFLFAFTYRFSTSLIDQPNLFYATLGGGGDYDQFIRASTCSLNLCSRIIHQNLLIESLILGSFYNIFGFIGGIKAYLYFMIILSSIVATLPYVLMSRKNFLTIGGIIGSLFLSTSDFLTQVALNYPPDNGSTFIFSMFFIIYLLTMHYGTIRWLIAFGLMGLFDGMFKALFLINDLVVLVLFAPLFFYERVKKVGVSFNRQFKLIFQSKNIKLLLLSLMPLFIFIVLYSAWEYFVQIKFTAPYFLKLLIQTGGSDFRFETLVYNRSSGESEHNLILQLFYLLISGLVMIKRIVSYSDLRMIFLAPIFFGLLLFSYVKSPPKTGWPLAKRFKIKLPLVKLGTIFVFSFVSIALLVSIKNNYLDIHQTFPGEYIYANWTIETYVGIFLFASIIFLSILNFKHQVFKLALPIIPYVVMLIILTKNAPWERLLVHVIVWSIILLSSLISWILANIALFSNRKIKNVIGLIILILFISFYSLPRIQKMIPRVNSGLKNMRTESEYLQWVNSSLPENAIVLGGDKSDLVSLGENISKPIVYNTLLSGALLIGPNEIPGVSPDDFTLINELQNKDNFERNRYIILEEDIDLWRARISGIGDGVFTTDPESITALHAEDFSIKVYKTNQELNKNIYELRPKE